MNINANYPEAHYELALLLKNEKRSLRLELIWKKPSVFALTGKMNWAFAGRGSTRTEWCARSEAAHLAAQ